MSALAFVPGLLIGAAYGYGAHRGAFCLNSGFRDLAMRGETTKVKALAVAVAIQLLLLPAVFALTGQRPVHPPFFPLAGVLGGLIFGASMHRAGGCAASLWHKAGAGDLGAAVSIGALALGALATETGALTGLRSALQAPWSGLSAAPAPTVFGLPVAAFGAVLGVVLLSAVWRSRDSAAGDWSWRRTGVWLGVLGLVAWPAAALVGSAFSLSVVPGTVGGVRALTVYGSPWPRWEVSLVLGIAAGGFMAARLANTHKLRAPPPVDLLRRFTGGLGLGVGASLAAGCTMGHGLTGLPLLAPGSIVVMVSILTGSAAAALLRAPRLSLRPVGGTT